MTAVSGHYQQPLVSAEQRFLFRKHRNTVTRSVSPSGAPLEAFIQTVALVRDFSSNELKFGSFQRKWINLSEGSYWKPTKKSIDKLAYVRFESCYIQRQSPVSFWKQINEWIFSSKSPSTKNKQLPVRIWQPRRVLEGSFSLTKIATSWWSRGSR